jgi:dihydroorotase
LIQQGVLKPLQAIAKLTCNPARIIGMDLGRLAPGSPADITLIDPHRAYTIDVNLFCSKSRNSPFHGWQVQGKVAMVLRDGKVISAGDTF